MTTGRVPCTGCSNMILPTTAAANGGLCAQCVRIHPAEREEGRAFDLALASGVLWRPSEKEMATAQTPSDLVQGTWNPAPDYYENEPQLTLPAVIDRAASGHAGEVFLVSASGSRLLVSLNSSYGVCEFQDEKKQDWRYAYSEENLRSQVPESLHLFQPCPCCGTGLGWYPSRAHMPRATAISVLSGIVGCAPAEFPARILWLEPGDISRYLRGRG